MFFCKIFKSHFIAICLLISTLLFATVEVEAGACAGCVDLDDLNFDKTIARFPYALVKFDIAFPYGEKHEAFAEFAKAAHKVTDELLIATIGIKDYGENENKALGERFGIDEKKFPGIILFKDGSTTTENSIKFPTHLDVTLDNLKSFVTQNTKLYIGRDGCLKEFNELARQYANLNKDKKAERLAKAEQLAKELKRENEKASAKSYIIFMKKITEKGYAFVEDEMKRLLRLKAGKVTSEKKTELQNKLNVLESFRLTKLTEEAQRGSGSSSDEL